MAMMSVEEVANYLDCEPKTVEEALRRRRLPGVKYGRSWRIPQTALDEVLHAEAMAARIKTPAAATIEPSRERKTRRSFLPILPPAG